VLVSNELLGEERDPDAAQPSLALASASALLGPARGAHANLLALAGTAGRQAAPSPPTPPFKLHSFPSTGVYRFSGMSSSF